MHISITQTDFTDLELRGQVQVAEAFTKRCQAIPDNFIDERASRASGLKRVDYLFGETRQVGLVRQGHEDGWDVIRLSSNERRLACFKLFKHMLYIHVEYFKERYNYILSSKGSKGYKFKVIHRPDYKL